MEAVGQYILSVTAAAVICGLLGKLLPKGGTAASVGKLLMGLFLAVTILSPWAGLQVSKWDDLTGGFYQQAQEAAQDGKQQSQESLCAIIKQRCEAYILDKAGDLHLDVEVSVTLTDDSVPAPSSVTITGAAAPYAKARLQDIIAQDLGIPKEKQLWN